MVDIKISIRWPMNRLDTVLPIEWTRDIWNSDTLKKKYQPIFQKISSAFRRIEIESVFEGYRSAAIIKLTPQELIQKQLSSNGYIVYFPFDTLAEQNNYQSSATRPGPGQPFHLRCLVADSSLPGLFKKYYQSGNTNAIGRLLGYPRCCIEFFEKYWVQEKYLDTTYPMSLAGLDGPRECNILWRWMNIRAISHLPCSFNCAATEEIGKDYIALGRHLKFNEEMNWLEEILEWPVQWSALHGIAEIKTPVVKISTRTDMTSDKVIVNYKGTKYPEDGSSGTSFPYKNKALVKFDRDSIIQEKFVTGKLLDR
jgi:hypothetical protein